MGVFPRYPREDDLVDSLVQKLEETECEGNKDHKAAAKSRAAELPTNTNESVFASSSLLVPDSSRLPRVLYRALSHARLVLHSIFLFPIISSRDSTNFYDMHCLQRPLHVIVSYNMDHYAVSVLVSLDPLVHCSSIRISTWIPVHLSDCPGSRSNIPPIYSFQYH